jgi:hypothetical protein
MACMEAPAFGMARGPLPSDWGTGMISEGKFSPERRPCGSVLDQRERREREHRVALEMTLTKAMAAVLAQYIAPGAGAGRITENRPGPCLSPLLEGPVGGDAGTPGGSRAAPAGLTPEQLREALGRMPDPGARALLLWAACHRESTGRWAGPGPARPADGGS